MQKKNYTVNFGDAVTVFPKKAVKKIIKGEATYEEIRVLAALMADPKITEIKLCTQTGLDEDVISESLSFWRGTGVISIDGSAQDISVQEKAAEEKLHEPQAPAKNNIIIKNTAPKYTGIEVSAMLDKDGGKLRDMIDTCQQLLGYIFTPSEIDKMLNLCDQQGLEAEYVVTLTAYLIEKRAKSKASYVCDRAYDLLGDGITTLDDLDMYIRDREIYDGIAGKLRTLMGIGGRDFTKKENGCINRWAKEYAYDFEMIKLAYEICCDANGSSSFKYIDTVLTNWHNAGVKTLADAEKEHTKFTDKKDTKGANAGLIKSFDTSEFFSAALDRTYKNMAKKPDNKS